LFNRFVGKPLALVHDAPGVTRDRREGDALWMGLTFKVIDTPGLYDPNNLNAPPAVVEGMRQQTLEAIGAADLILFVVDGLEGCTPYDEELANVLRRKHKPVLVVMNKCENASNAYNGLGDALALGLGDVAPISAAHGQGMDSLYDAIAPLCAAPEEDEEGIEEATDEAPSIKPLKLLVLGRPNVGKSTLVNRLLGEERQLVADMPGVTRDSIALDWQYQGRPITLVDTAGIRRRSKIDTPLENLAVMDSRRALQYAQVVILVIDGTIPLEAQIEKQDITLAQEVVEEGRAMVMAINKWDAVPNPKALMDEVRYQLDNHFAQAKDIPCLGISAQKGTGINALMEAVFTVEKSWNTRIPTAELNRWLGFVLEKHPPPAVAGRRIRLKYMTQKKSRPPTFALFGNQLDDLPESYTRYLMNQLRQDFNLKGIPLRFHFKNSQNPYGK
jgi:GTP-binding protein